jgi:TRAP-type transport system periplasmic protein
MSPRATSVSRRTLLQGAAATAGTLAAPAILRAQGGRTLRLAHMQAVEHANHRGSLHIQERLRELTGGRLGVDLFPAAQLGGALQQTEQVSNGTLDIAIDGPGIWTTFVPRFSIMEAFFVAQDFEHFQRMLASELGQELQAELRDQFDIRLLGNAYYGSRNFTGNRAIRTPADLAGFKLRVPEVPLYLDFARAIGSSPTPLAFPEVYLALQTGVVDGQENPLTVIDGQKFYEVQEFLSLTWHVVNSQQFAMNEQVWQELGEADQEALTTAIDEGCALITELVKKGEEELIAKFEGHGMTIVHAERETFIPPVFEMYREKYVPVWGEGVLEAMQALRG